jgi:hypothetical protein
MIDFPLVEVDDPVASLGVRLAFDSLEQLGRGADGALDCICDGIAHGAPFVIERAQKPAAA